MYIQNNNTTMWGRGHPLAPSSLPSCCVAVRLPTCLPLSRSLSVAPVAVVRLTIEVVVVSQSVGIVVVAVVVIAVDVNFIWRGLRGHCLHCSCHHWVVVVVVVGDVGVAVMGATAVVVVVMLTCCWSLSQCEPTVVLL